VLSNLSSTSHVTNAASVIADSLPDGRGGTITQGSAGSIDFAGDRNITALHINVVNT
jgi:hypothetical protein